jgi:hypothetical protein
MRKGNLALTRSFYTRASSSPGRFWKSLEHLTVDISSGCVSAAREVRTRTDEKGQDEASMFWILPLSSSGQWELHVTEWPILPPPQIRTKLQRAVLHSMRAQSRYLKAFDLRTPNIKS